MEEEGIRIHRGWEGVCRAECDRPDCPDKAQTSRIVSITLQIDGKRPGNTSTNSISFSLKRNLSLQLLLSKYAFRKAWKKTASVNSLSCSSLHTCNGSNCVAYGGFLRHMCSHLHFVLGKHCMGTDSAEQRSVLDVGSVGVPGSEARGPAPMNIFRRYVVRDVKGLFV